MSGSRHLRPLTVTFLLAGAAIAQCTNPWVPSYTVGGVDGTVRAFTTWDPDGTGPATPLWVVGGDFTFAGGSPASRIAAFDPATGIWTALGTGCNGPVRALAVLSTGELVAGGTFTTAGGIVVNYVARWNGAAWSALGGGTSQDVQALHVRPNGDLIAGGFFTTAGGAAVTGIARWDGSAWSALGVGGSPALSLATLANGDLVAGSAYLNSTAPLIKRWNGSTWTGIPGTTGATGFTLVTSLQVLPNGHLVAFGFNLGWLIPGSVVPATIARWNGLSWSAMPVAPGVAVSGITQTPTGEIIATVGANSLPTAQVLRWTGAAWVPFAADLPASSSFVLQSLPGGDLLAGGSFTSGGIGGLARFARWDGAAWRSVGTGGPQREVTALATGPGDLTYATWYEPVGTPDSYHLASFDGTAWTELGTANGSINAMTILPNGDLVTGGRFTTCGGVAANYLARFDGTTWTPLSTAAPFAAFLPEVHSLLAKPDGTLVVSGNFTAVGATPCNGIATFDGSTWSPLGPGLLGYAKSLLLMPNGDLVAGGTFLHDGNVNFLGRLGRWNGTTWSNFGLGLNGDVATLVRRPNGDLIVGGQFTQAGGVAANHMARWNGSWSNIGDVSGSYVSKALALPNGDLVAAGSFAAIGGVGAANIARWNGASWSPFGSGTDGNVVALAASRNGDLALGGYFDAVGGQPSPNFARITTSCPATVTIGGPGCSTAALTPTSLPWLGTPFHARATGLPANSIAIHVLGLSAVNVPLAVILPQSLPGCMLLAQPDVFDLGLPFAGVLDVSFPLSSSQAYVGFEVEQQVVALGLGPSGDIVTVTATNSLHLSEGFF